MIQEWNRIKSDNVFSCRVFSVRKDISVSPYTSREHDFYVIEAPTWVNVIALTENMQIVLIEQYRHGISSNTIEIPGGMVDQGEKPINSAKRELLEETGYESNKWTFLGGISPNPAIQNNICYTFLAENVKKIREPKFDTAEDIMSVLTDFDKVPELVKQGRINHSLVITAFYLYKLLLDKEITG